MAPMMKSTPAAPYSAAVTRGGSALFSIAQLLVLLEPEKREAGQSPGFRAAPPSGARRFFAIATGGWPTSCRSPREGEVRANGVERWDGIAHAGIRRADAWIHKANPQFALWMARLSTAMAASCTVSDRDGWAWQMRARSSAEPLNSMVSTPSCTSSDTFGPIRCMQIGRAHV